MATTLELTNGTLTLDLQGTTYVARDSTLDIAPPPAQLALAGNSLSRQTFGPREIRMGLTVYGTTVPLLETNIRILDNMLASAANRQFYNQSPVTLKVQLGNTDADDISYRVLRGSFSLPPTVLSEPQTTTAKAIAVGTLSLLVEPLGRLSQVTLTEVILENEQDGDNNNYVDIEGAFNGYLEFDATDDVVTVTDQAAIQNVFDSGGTVGAWIYAKSDGEATFGRIIDKAAWSVYVEGSTGGKVQLVLQYGFSGTNGTWKTASTEITLNTWTRVEVTYDADAVGNDPIFYIDGASVTLTETSTPVGTRTTDVGSDLLFGNNAATTRTFDGFIDNPYMFSDVRSAAEALTDGTAEFVGNEAGLVGYWPFNDSAGSTARDHTSNGNDGAITGAAWGIGGDSTGGGRPLGTESGRMQIKINDEATVAWAGSKKIWIAKRSGARRTDDLFIQGEDETSFTEGSDPSTNNVFTFSSDGADASKSGTSSAGQMASLIWTNGTAGAENTQASWESTGQINYQIAGGSLPEGIFRVLVRFGVIRGTNASADEMGLALGWSFGGVTKTPLEADYVYRTLGTTVESFQTLDIGEITIPPHGVPDGYTEPTLEIRVFTGDSFAGGPYSIPVSDTLEWQIDCIYLVPFDEGMVAVDAVSTTDRILIDNLSDAPGVYKLNSSDVVQSAATKVGSPFNIGPEPTRIYILRDDTGDPSTVKFDVNIQHTPQVIGI